MKYIKISTAIPGPKSEIVFQNREKAVGRGISTAFPIAIENGRGAILEDVDGNSYIDMAAGIASLNVGHSPEPVVHALKNQLNNYINPVFNVTMHLPYVELAEKLNEIVPGNGDKKTVLFNSGAEAVENAVKIARRYTGRKAIISFERSFHGRTLLGMTLTGKVKSVKAGFGPMATDVYQTSYPYYYQDLRSDEELLEDMNRLFYKSVDPNDVAAIIMEPIQGDGGFIVPSKKFVQSIRKTCDQHGIVMIADEIQTGFGRTGKMFAMEHFNTSADITVMSKSIAAGIPLSAVTGKSEIVNYPKTKELGGTLSGSTLACVAAIEVIEMIKQQDLLKRANDIGNIIKKTFDFSSKHVGDIRGVGAMIGIEFVDDKQSKCSIKPFVQKVVKECFEKGVLLLTAADGNVIRLLPPLVINDDQLNEALQVIKSVIQNLEASEMDSI